MSRSCFENRSRNPGRSDHSHSRNSCHSSPCNRTCRCDSRCKHIRHKSLHSCSHSCSLHSCCSRNCSHHSCLASRLTCSGSQTHSHNHSLHNLHTLRILHTLYNRRSLRKPLTHTRQGPRHMHNTHGYLPCNRYCGYCSRCSRSRSHSHHSCMARWCLPARPVGLSHQWQRHLWPNQLAAGHNWGPWLLARRTHSSNSMGPQTSHGMAGALGARSPISGCA